MADDSAVAVALVQEDGSKAMTAARNIATGEKVGQFSGEMKAIADSHTVHVGENKHVAPNSPERYTNHSCEANTNIDFEDFSLVACRDIPAGEWITYNYNTTEHRMAAPFKCGCRSKNCLGEVGGFSLMEKAKQDELRPFVSPVVLSMAK